MWSLFRGEPETSGAGRGERGERGGKGAGGDAVILPFPDHPDIPAAPAPISAGEYRVDAFYTRSSDNNGHRTQLRVMLPQDMADVVGIVARAVPGHYRSGQDFVRDAIIHRAQWIAEHQEDLDLERELVKQRLRSEMERTKVRLDADNAYVDDAREVLEAAMMGRDGHGVAVTVANLRDMVDMVGEWMRDEIEAMVARGEEWLRRNG